MTDANSSSFLEDDILDDCQSQLQLPSQDRTTLVHSTTTDTLDSVDLGPSEDLSGLENVLSEESHTEPVQFSDAGMEIMVDTKEEFSGSTGPRVCNDVQSISLPDGRSVKETESIDFFGKGIDTTTTEVAKEAQTVDTKEEVSISSYFATGPDQDDPFGSVVKSPSIPSDMHSKMTKEIKEDVNYIHHEPLESKISQEESEMVNFSVPEDKGDPNVKEPSMDVLDDKEDFESFTAESGPPDMDDFALGVSPSNKFLTDRMNKMHINDNSQGENTSLSKSDYSRQLSSSSTHSLGGFQSSTQNMTPPIGPSPIHQPFQGAPFSASQFSPFSTPTHQPVIPPETKQQEPTSTAVPTDTVCDEKPVAVSTVPEVSSQSPFNSLPVETVEDPFTASLNISDSDRQYDAWIPSDNTRKILVTMATSIPGTFIPTVEQLSCPGIIVDEPLGDPVRDLVFRYMGEQEAIKRTILTVDTVTQDVDGLKKLIGGGCYRSAVNLTCQLLSVGGQGSGKVGQITQHTPHILQLWFTRLVLLMKLRLYSVAESELVAFQNLDTPDLYYEFYPHIYPGRKGSMVPFGMRVLHAELPHYMGRSQEALDRLYYVLAVVQKILSNLEKGFSEDGTAVEISDESRKVSTGIWQERERRVLYLIGNTLFAIRDYESAMSVYDLLISKDPSCKAALLSGMGRLYLQIRNINKAKNCFQRAEILSDSSNKSIQCRNYLNKGLESMCMDNFSEAYENFKCAVDADPSNACAVNNMAACSLYLGRLMDALKTLEIMVHDDPNRNLHEGVLFNLCTLYELESTRALHKKQALLDLVSRYKGDGFPVACLKMA